MAGVSDLANLLQFAMAVKNQFEQAVLNVRPRRATYKSTPNNVGTFSSRFHADRTRAAVHAFVCAMQETRLRHLCDRLANLVPLLTDLSRVQALAHHLPVRAQLQPVRSLLDEARARASRPSVP